MTIHPFGSNVYLRRLPAGTRWGAIAEENATETPDESFAGLLAGNISASVRLEGMKIHIPQQFIEHDSFECEVLAVGPGEIMPNGKREPMNVKPGDVVIVFQGCGTPVGEKDHFIVDITGLEAVIER